MPLFCIALTDSESYKGQMSVQRTAAFEFLNSFLDDPSSFSPTSMCTWVFLHIWWLFQVLIKFTPVTQDCRLNHRSPPFVSGTLGYIWPKRWHLYNMLVSHDYRSLCSPIPTQCQLYGLRGEEIKGKYIFTLGRVLQVSGGSLHCLMEYRRSSKVSSVLLTACP